MTTTTIKRKRIPVIMIAPSAGHKNDSSSVNVLLNIAGVDANLQNNIIQYSRDVLQ